LKEKYMQKITPFLWFEDNAEEAVNFYVSVFSNSPSKDKNSKIAAITRYDEEGAKASGRPAGTVMTIGFELSGQEFAAINGGPMPPESEFKVNFTGAISFVINCDTQEEVDYFWEKLSEGGESGVCGWINHDKFGMTWQVTPRVLPEMLMDKDPEKARRAMAAMLKMTKLDIAVLEKAYRGE
jgi:predicted 3-demethylubiquinone-9 3-methyltransferase (glyoxalase superfamily)